MKIALYLLGLQGLIGAHHIHYRADVPGSGWRKIFVTQEDKIRAREIVHEIEEGSPPR